MLRVAMAHENGGVAVVQCDDMALAGDVIADLAAFLGVAYLEVVCDFPLQMEPFEATLRRLSELSALRSSLSGDLAESMGSVKAAVLRAEDARVRGEMGGVRKHYSELRSVVGTLAQEYGVRAGVHAALAEALKEVNVTIQKAAALRGALPQQPRYTTAPFYTRLHTASSPQNCSWRSAHKNGCGSACCTWREHA